MAKKGNSGTFGKGRLPTGRPKGVPNKATREIKEAARAFLENPEGLARLKEQYEAGTLNPSILIRYMDYAYGKPKETIEHQVPMRSAVVDLLQPGEGVKGDDD